MSYATRMRFHPCMDPAFYPAAELRSMRNAGLSRRVTARIMRRFYGPLWRLRVLW